MDIWKLVNKSVVDSILIIKIAQEQNRREGYGMADKMLAVAFFYLCPLKGSILSIWKYSFFLS